MKKLLSLILTVSMLLSMATVVGTSVSAETDVYNITFDEIGETSKSYYEITSENKIGTSGRSLYFKGDNGKKTSSSYIGDTTAFGLKVADLGESFSCGTYSVSVWVDASGIQSMSFWLSFSESGNDATNLAATECKVLICDKKNGNPDENYVGDTLATGNVNGKWKEYATEVYVPEGTRYVYAWSNYGKDYSGISQDNGFYVDNVKLTKIRGALGSFDDVEGFNNPSIDAVGYFEGSETVFHTAGGKSAVLTNVAVDGGYNIDSDHLYKDNSGGAHRTALKPLSNAVDAGLYKVSVWVLDNSNNGIDCQLLISFHAASTKEDGTDEALNINFTKDNTSSITKIYDTNDEHLIYYDVGGDSFEQGHLNEYKSVLQPTGRKENCGDGNTWCEYSGLISVALLCTQYSLWFYRPLNYDGEVKTSNPTPICVDDVLLTEFEPECDSIFFYDEEHNLLDEYTMEEYLGDLENQHYENEVLKYKTGLFDNYFKENGKRVWSLLTPQGYVIGQAITTFFHEVGIGENRRKYPNEMYWNVETQRFEITVTARDEDVFDIVVSYDDSAKDGVIDHLYFNTVMFDDAQLLHTESYWFSFDDEYAHYYNMYRFGILFAEEEEKDNKHYATDEKLKLYEHGGYPLFVKANPIDRSLGYSLKDSNKALDWYDSVLESCDGKGAYLESSVPLELTAQNIMEGTDEEGDLDGKIIAFRWEKFPAYDQLGVRAFYVTATGYTVYCNISFITFTEGVPVLPLKDSVVSSNMQ